MSALMCLLHMYYHHSYEIQLQPEVRRKGLGKFMMQILELIGHKYVCPSFCDFHTSLPVNYM